MKTENAFLKHKTAPACFVSVEISQRTPLKKIRTLVSPWALGFYTGIGLTIAAFSLLDHYEPLVRGELVYPISVSPFTP